MSDDFLRLLDVGACAWLRWLPDNGVTLLQFALSDRATSLEDVFAQSRIDPTGSALAKLPHDDEIHAAAEIRSRDLIARATGRPLQTNRDLFDALLILGTIEANSDTPSRLWRVPDPAPSPQELLSLTDAEQEKELRIEFGHLDERLAQSIIELFVSDEVTEIRTSIERLARLLECEPEAARGAVIAMLAVGDFSTPADIPHIGVADEFALTVDWDRFHQERISVELTMPDDDGTS